MLRLPLNLFIAALLFAAAVHAEEPASQPAPAPQTAAGQPDPAENWLDAISAKALTIKSLRAKVRYDRVQVLQGDEQRRFGKLLYIAGPPAQFKVQFNTLLVDKTPRKQDQSFIFDGQWLVEQLDEKKQFYKRQIVSPDADPKKVDPLALGAGPFSLPLNAKKEAIMERFHVQVLDTSGQKNDPPNSVHLRLTPKDANSDIEQINLWYSLDTLLPIKGESLYRGSGDVDVFHLLDPIELNSEVKPDEIDTRAPSQKGERGWLEEITPWSKN